MYIREYLEHNKELFGKKWSKTFLEKVNFSLKKLTSRDKNIERKINVPSYLNDLGMRRFNSPSLEYKKLLENGYLERIDLVRIKQEFLIASLKDLADLLDVFVLVIGNYDLPQEMVLLRKKEMLNSDNYNLLIYSGTLMGINYNDISIDFFKKASEISQSKEDEITALHREMVYKVKRKKNYKNMGDEFENLFLKINELKLKDKLLFEALLDNLYGLYVVKLKIDNIQKNVIADIILRNAQVLIQQYVKIEENNVKLNEAYRYMNQVFINRAQLMVGLNKFDEAKKILESDLFLTKKNAPDYLPEVQSALSYEYYLTKEYSKSIQMGQMAINGFDSIEFYEGELAVKNILIASYFKSGNLEKAQEINKSLRGL